MALSVAELLMRVTGDDRSATSTLAQVRAEMQALAASHAEATVDVDSTQAKRKLVELEAALDLIGRRSPSVKIQVETRDARAKMAALRRELDAALSGGSGARDVRLILRDIDRLGESIGRIGRITGGSVLQGMKALFSGAMSLGDVLRSLTTGAISFGQSIGELGSKIGGSLLQGVMGLVAAFIQLNLIMLVLIPVITVLAGVIMTVVVAIGNAVLGAGALAIAFGAVLVPILGVLLAGFIGVARAIANVKKEKDEAKKAAQEYKQSLDQLATAQRNLADAQEARGREYENALRAQRDAVDAVKNAELARKDALLGIEDADIALDRAKLNLKQLREEASGAGRELQSMFRRFENVDYRINAKDLVAAQKTIESDDNLDEEQKLRLREGVQALARANLGVDQAAQRAKESTDNLTDAQKRQSEFLKEGLTAYEPYENALDRVADAQKNLSEATERVRKAKVADDEAQSKLTSSAHKTAESFMEVGKQIAKAFGPAGRVAMEGVLKLAKDFADTLMDPGIQRGLMAIGRAFSSVFVQFGRLLRTREVREIFADLAVYAARVVRVFGSSVFGDLFLAMTRFARAAAPGLLRFFERVGDSFAGWERGTRNATRLRRTADGLADSFINFMGLIKDVGRLLIVMFKDGKEEGDGLVSMLRRAIRRLTEFLDTDEGRQKFKEWLQDSVEWAKNVWNVFKDWIEILKDVLGIMGKIIDGAGKVQKILGAPGNWVQNKLGLGDGRQMAKNMQSAVANVEDVARKQSGDTISRDLYNTLLSNLTGAGIDEETARKILQELKKKYRLRGFASGGVVPGLGGFGDDGVFALEGGEFIIRRAAVQGIGPQALHALNEGQPMLDAARLSKRDGGKGGGSVTIHAPISAPPATYPSPEWVAKKLGDLAGTYVM